MDNNPKVMTIEQQALALVNEMRAEYGLSPMRIGDIPESAMFAALRTALERHEADKAAWQTKRQEVSEAAKEVLQIAGHVEVSLGSAVLTRIRNRLSRFIIAPPPVDPLVAAIEEAGEDDCAVLSTKGYAERLRAALAAHGLQITGVET